MTGFSSICSLKCWLLHIGMSPPAVNFLTPLWTNLLSAFVSKPLLPHECWIDCWPVAFTFTVLKCFKRLILTKIKFLITVSNWRWNLRYVRMLFNMRETSQTETLQETSWSGAKKVSSATGFWTFSPINHRPSGQGAHLFVFVWQLPETQREFPKA